MPKVLLVFLEVCLGLQLNNEMKKEESGRDRRGATCKDAFGCPRRLGWVAVLRHFQGRRGESEGGASLALLLRHEVNCLIGGRLLFNH